MAISLQDITDNVGKFLENFVHLSFLGSDNLVRLLDKNVGIMLNFYDAYLDWIKEKISHDDDLTLEILRNFADLRELEIEIGHQSDGGPFGGGSFIYDGSKALDILLVGKYENGNRVDLVWNIITNFTYYCIPSVTSFLFPKKTKVGEAKTYPDQNMLTALEAVAKAQGKKAIKKILVDSVNVSELKELLKPSLFSLAKNIIAVVFETKANNPFEVMREELSQNLINLRNNKQQFTSKFETVYRFDEQQASDYYDKQINIHEDLLRAIENFSYNKLDGDINDPDSEKGEFANEVLSKLEEYVFGSEYLNFLIEGLINQFVDEPGAIYFYANQSALGITDDGEISAFTKAFDGAYRTVRELIEYCNSYILPEMYQADPDGLNRDFYKNPLIFDHDGSPFQIGDPFAVLSLMIYEELAEQMESFAHRMNVWNGVYGLDLGKEIFEKLFDGKADAFENIIREIFYDSGVKDYTSPILVHEDGLIWIKDAISPDKIEKLMEKLEDLIAESILEDIKSNRIITDMYDPRLNILTPVSERIGGIFGNSEIYDGANIADLIYSFIPEARKILEYYKEENISAQKGEHEIILQMISDSLREGTSVLDNDVDMSKIPNATRLNFSDREKAHELLQLVCWSNDMSKFQTACDPKMDPFPEDEDHLDEEMKKYGLSNTYIAMVPSSDGGWIKTERDLFENSENISGNVFSKDGVCYVVFNESETLINAISEKNEVAFKGILDEAYVFLRNMLISDIPGIFNLNAGSEIVLLGYGAAGALAAALSAALYAGGFTADGKTEFTENGEKINYGEYSNIMANLGWAIDDKGRLLDNFEPMFVNALTFNAPDISWFFKDVELVIPREWNEEYGFSETDIKRGDALTNEISNTPVANYGLELNGDFKTLLEAYKDGLQIGTYFKLTDSQGKLTIVREILGGSTVNIADLEIWNNIETLELALHDNKPPSGSKPPVSYFSDAEAHEYLQLVTWASEIEDMEWMGSDPHDWNSTCDPKRDPMPENPDDLDDDISRYKLESYSARFAIFKNINGNIYIVFMDGFSNVKDRLNWAYQLYRNTLDKYDVKSANVTLLGVGSGGALAAALSAALYDGAFTADSAASAYGVYNATLAQFGFYPDKFLNGEECFIEGYPPEAVKTLTFNAPGIADIFTELELKWDENSQEFYLEETEKIRKDISDVPVTNYRMKVPRTLSYWMSSQSDVGKSVTLGALNGKLGTLIKSYDGDVTKITNEFWNSLNALELALHKPGKVDPPQEPDFPPQPPLSPPRIPPQPKRDPLIIDLNRDGKVSTSSGTMYFDIDGNGFLEQTKWAANGDGLLVMDRDGDGKITTGKELFGDFTVMSNGKIASSGFEALADLDSNGDGIIDANDESYHKLRIWADMDEDGVFGENDLFTLEELGIESINLKYYDERYTDENGNNAVRSSTVTWKNGDTSKISEFLLARDTYRSVQSEEIAVPSDIASLPDVPASGYLYSLHQAMARDESGEIKTLLENFVAETNPLARRAILDEIFLKWSAVSDLVKSENTGIREFLDKFYGELTENFPTDEPSQKNIDVAYDMAKQYIYSSLLRQTHFGDVLGLVGVAIDDESEDFRIYLDIGDALEYIVRTYQNDSEQARNAIAEFFMALRTSELAEFVDKDCLEAYKTTLAAYGTGFYEACVASMILFEHPIYEYSIPLFSAESGGTVYGDRTNNIIAGLDGNDKINGGNGDDTIIGGKGDDTLSGSSGADTYLWSLGDGNDTIIDDAGFNILRVGDGVHPENARIERSGSTVYLIIGESGERITISTRGGSETDPNLQIARIEFADGTNWTRDYIHSLVLEYDGTDGSDTLTGSSGNDVINGGKGDDYLAAGYGSDTYIWNPGDGNDKIFDSRYYSDVNILKIGEGVNPENVVLHREGNALILTVGETGERITLESWYGQYVENMRRLHRIEFADGTVWTPETVRVFGNGAIEGTDGNDLLDGLDGDDTIIGNKGDDLLRGGNGNDTYVWNPGDGNDTIFDTSNGGQINVLRFGDGVSASDITVRRNGGGMFFIFNETGEKITVPGWNGTGSSDDPPANKLARVEFGDGTVWTGADVENIVGDYVIGTDGDDTLTGLYYKNDVIIGGKGNDNLSGNGVADTYVWNLGDGNDKISENWNSYGTGVIKFGEGVSPENIRGERSGQSLILTIGESGETITLNYWFTYLQGKSIRIEFADGVVWTQENLKQFIIYDLIGTDGDDVLTGFEDDNTLVGGKGNDRLAGGQGSDTYIWNLGDGNDVISEHKYGEDVNVLKFGEGVNPEDISILRNVDDLVIRMNATSETVTVSQWYVGTVRRLTRIEFADGTVWDTQEIDGKLDSRIIGTDGDDRLYGTTGNEIIVGGRGNDFLHGGYGEDIYIWNPGDGSDVIYDQTRNSEANTLRFGEGAEKADFKIVRQELNLIFVYEPSGETITIQNWWFTGSNFRMSKVLFADGSEWTREDIEAATAEQWGTAGNDALTGTPGDDIMRGLGGADAIRSGAGNDVYIWNRGDGNDTIYIERTENDAKTLKFGANVEQEDITLQQRDNDLLVNVNPTGERLRLVNWYASDRNNLEKMEFADGSFWDADEIESRLDRVLAGTDGNDTITGGAEDSTIIGGKGKDTLRGGAGSDTYVWNLGDGNDTIVDVRGGTDVNILKFGPGINPGDIDIKRSARDLIAFVNPTGEFITVSGWYLDDANKLSGIEFSDGTFWTTDEIISKYDGASTISGTDSADAVDGTPGDDVIIGFKGNDTLRGGGGDDVYVWNVGDGTDTILDTSGYNALRFGEGILPQDVYFSKNINGLVISCKGGYITVKNWYPDGENSLSEIQFDDGSIISAAEIARKVFDTVGIGDENVNYLYGTYSGHDYLEGGDGDDHLSSSYGTGSDVYYGGKGDDFLTGGNGDDVYIWNRGDGNDRISDTSGSNVIRFGEGITKSDILRFEAVNNYDLVLFIGPDEEKITLTNSRGLSSLPWTFQFADGTQMTRQEINAIISVIHGPAGQDDYLRGDMKTDGGDVYRWNLGDGNDTFSDTRGNNVLEFGPNIKASDVTISNDRYDLILSVGDESVRIEGWYDDPGKVFEFRFEDGTIWSRADLNEMIKGRTPTEDSDIIIGSESSEELHGLDGDDVIIGGDGGDTVVGGKGSDLLYGGAGDDTYIFNPGDGVDYLRDSQGSTIIQFGEGVRPEDVYFARNAGNAQVNRIVNIKTDDAINFDADNPLTRVSEIRFADGTVWTNADYAEHTAIVGTQYYDGIYDSSASQPTKIFGLAGGDTISSGSGDDIIEGGTGDDYLFGNAGSDTYIWNPGDGNDTISDSDSQGTLKFGAGVDPEKVIITRKDGVTVFSLLEHYSQITVNSALSGVSFDDGTLWSWEDVSERATESRVFMGTPGDDALKGTDSGDIFYGGAGTDRLSGSLGKDRYLWNPGDGGDIITDRLGGNVLEIGGVPPETVGLLRNSLDLFLEIGETGERIAVKDWFHENEKLRFGEIHFSDGTVWTFEDVENMSPQFIEPTEGGDVIQGSRAPENLAGLGGGDTINGDKGDDILTGGAGDDILNGGEGDDTYIWNIGDGNDVITDHDGKDTLVFGDGVDSASVKIRRNGADLYFEIGDETITVDGWFDRGGYTSLRSVVFADGTTWDITRMYYQSAEMFGTSGHDEMDGTDETDVITGMAGDDILRGGGGADIYVWNPGDGNDTISDAEGQNVLSFGEGVPASSVQVKRDGSDLRFIIGEETVTVAGWFEEYGSQLAEVRFADGTFWNSVHISDLARRINGTDGADELLGTDGGDILTGGEGGDVLKGGHGDDVYVWRIGDGNDTISDGSGANILQFGEGVTPGDISLSSEGSSLVMYVLSSGERVNVEGWFDSDENKLSEVRFADGSVWTWDEELQGLKCTETEGGDASGSPFNAGSFVWNRGDGDVEIPSYALQGYGVLEFGEGVKPGEISIAVSGSTVQVIVGDYEAVISAYPMLIVMSAFSISPLAISQPTGRSLYEIRFADGTVWNEELIDIISSGGSVFAGDGEDNYLYGYSASGKSVLIGREGKDTLEGSYSDDVFVWNLGDGNDSVTGGGGNNVLHLGPGISPEDVKLFRNYDRLIAVVQTSWEAITVNDWYSADNHFGEIRFNDGNVWTFDDVYVMDVPETGPTESDDFIIGTSENDTLFGLGGDDDIEGGDGDDRIIGGPGSDRLEGGPGRDTYVWNVGDGSDIINDAKGGGTIEFGEGVTAADVRVSKEGDSLALTVGEETITVFRWFIDLDTPDKRYGVLFSDGTSWSAEYLHELASSISGTSGNDFLDGTYTDDIFMGREGNDTLNGRQGNNIYFWNLGDGNDTITDLSADYGSAIRFGEGVNPSDVVLRRDANNMYFEIGGERVTVKNWFSNLSGNALGSVIFADGTQWSRAWMESEVNRITGTDGNDTLNGYSSDDTLTGGPGDDILAGGAGADAYIWNTGDGNDIIRDRTGLNKLIFGEGIAPASVTVSRDNDHLYFTVGGERITAENWFPLDTANSLEVHFADGTVWSRDEINDMSRYYTGTDAGETLMGNDNFDDVLSGLGGKDTIHAGSGNDIIEGGTGDDVLDGGAGNDTYIWNVGDGSDTIIDIAGNNSLAFGDGVSTASVQVSKNGPHMCFIIGDERITVENWFPLKVGNQFEVRFADGTVWNNEKIFTMFATVLGTPADDALSGGTDNDTYVWNIGDGNDTVRDTGGRDRIVFGDGINPDDVGIAIRDADIVFTIGSESVTVINWFTSDAFQLEEIRFSDGVTWSPAHIHELLGLTVGTKNSDMISGSAGADTVIAFQGDDRLYGGEGDDTYIWAPGHGGDNILDASGNNVLKFAGNVTPDDVTLSRDDGSLYITYDATGEKLRIESWFSGRSNKLSIEFSDGTAWTPEYVDSRFAAITGTDAGDAILGYDSTGETIYGNAGDDIISGLGGDDTLVGGAGDDKLYGGRGDDTYVWNIGDGSDVINDEYGANVLKFGEGVNPGSVTATRDANNLYLNVGETGETVRVENWFRKEKNRLASVEFANGTVWDRETVEGFFAESGDATPGDDIIHGTSGDDVLDGLAGNDVIYGKEGNDILVGRTGRDVLYGGGGDDTYFWNLGDGNDIIADDSGNNRLLFGSGIFPDMVTYTPYGMDLMISVGGDGEYILVRDWFSSGENRLSKIEFSDGTFVTPDEIDANVRIISGTASNDTLSGSELSEIISGFEGNDRLYGNGGKDTLIGGLGDDYLDGGNGDDSFIWNPGDGNDTIYDYSGRNILSIGAGADPSLASIQRSGNNLVILIGETGESITVSNWYSYDVYKLAEVRFADGTVWTAADINGMKPAYNGTKGDDTIGGSVLGDIIDGKAGNDALYGYGGSDTLTGGAGDDYLDGGAGDDVYLWSPGDGNDTINDSSGVNVLKIGAGVNPSSVEIWRSGDKDQNAVFVIGETGEHITVLNWFSASANQLARIEFADGTVWTRLDIADAAVIGRGTDGDDTLYGSHIRDTLEGLAGDDKLFGYAENDTLSGGTGNDTLYGGAGNDTYLWNPGDGSDVIIDSEGNNVLVIGGGLTAGDLKIDRGGDDISFLVSGTEEKITVKDWYAGEKNQLSEIRFSDGSVWTREEINLVTPVFEVKDGEDTASGSAGDDLVLGGSGDDTLYGNAGNDIISGGEGDDRLIGGAGDDTYIWNPGDGNDTITDTLGDNTLQIGGGVNPDDVEVSREGNDLVITIQETGETITVTNWGSSENARLYEVQFSDGTVWDTDYIDGLLPPIELSTQDLTINGTAANDVLTGGFGSDKLYGLGGNDILSGGDGNDSLYGGDGNDILAGGAGTDYLEGGTGSDVYVWNLGDENDTINDYRSSKDYYKETGVLKIGEGVNPENIEITREGNTLVLIVGETGERITLQNWYLSADYQLNEVEFADGSKWTRAQINAMSPVIRGTDENDTITGTASNDILFGGPGDDTIKGGDGNDTLTGGAGADYLEGGTGSDVYVWNIGDGNDTINDYRASKDYYKETGVLKIGESVNPENIEITRDGNTLVLIIGETGERITLQNWYLSADYQLNEVEFADGSKWTRAQINAMSPVIRGTDENDTITGTASNDILFGGSGDDTIKGGDGNDTLTGGAGSDYLEGGTGNDVYVWNIGDGNDTINDYRSSKDYYKDTGLLKIGGGVVPENIEITRVGNNLVLIIGETGERITLQNWYASTDYQLNEVEFADGTKWTRAQINAMSPVIRGTDGDDTITGTASNDILFGGSGDDTIKGGDGNDTLTGGEGSDYLEGGTGNDVYVWNLGDGNDTINDYRSSKDYYKDTGLLKIGEGVAAENIEITREVNNIVFIIGETGERITLQNWYASTDYQLNEVEFADGTKWTRAEINAMSPVIRGTAGDDTINGTASNDVLLGGAGDDTIKGLDGNDTFIGGAGADILEGGTGNDVYVWNLGDGNDTINDYRASKDYYKDTGLLKIGEGVNPESIEITRAGNNIVFIIAESGEKITVQNWYASTDYQLNEVEFADGTKWTRAEINATSPVIRGTDGDDTITGTASNDVLHGGAGDDTIKGGDGNDTLTGGEGSDYLEGGTGNDVYVWNLGDGNDTINDYRSSKDYYKDTGLLKIGGGVVPENIEITREGNNLAFIIGETEERITFQNWYSSTDYQLNEVEFADGTKWTRAQINAMSPVIRGTDGNDTINGTASSDVLIGGSGDDTIKGLDGNDTLIGGAGADILEGGTGNDVYVWNLGDGNDIINDYRSSKDYYKDTGLLKLGEGVAPENIEITRAGNNLVFIIGGTDERVTLQNWYTSTDYQLNEVEFADGTKWTRAQINAMSPVIRGTDGNETVTGTASNDILIGGAGSDRLEGGAGNDVYKWNLGDGNDLIVDNSGTNLLELGEGINPMDIALARLGNDAVFTVGSTGEQISVYNWYANANYQLSSVQFKDGTVWNRTDINNSTV